MIHHYITKYYENGTQYAEAWLQLDLFKWCWCFSRRKIEIKKRGPNASQVSNIKVPLKIDGRAFAEAVIDSLEGSSRVKEQITKKLTRKDVEAILNILEGVNKHQWESFRDVVDIYFRRRVNAFISNHELAVEADEKYFSEVLNSYKD